MRLKVQKAFEYQFSPSNPYLQGNNLMDLGIKLNNDLQVVEAVKVLEAEL